MPRATRRSRTAYTLVELMIVVAIVGVLAMLAIYGVRKYIASSKTVEARNALGQIGKNASTSWEQGVAASGPIVVGAPSHAVRALCMSASKTVPSSFANVKNQKYQSN